MMDGGASYSTPQEISPYSEESRQQLLRDGFKIDFRLRLDNFRDTFPLIFKVYDSLGLAPFLSTRSKTNYFNDQQDDEDFSNIGQHMVAVATVVDCIAEPLEKWGAISFRQKEEAILLALLHDLNRIFEIYQVKAYREVRLSRTQQKMDEVLSSVGMSDEMIRLVHDACAITTYYGLGRFLTKSTGGALGLKNSSASEWLVRLGDDMTCSRAGNHYIFSPLERFIAAGYFVDPLKDPGMWKPMAICPDGSITTVVEGDFDISEAIVGQTAALHMHWVDLSVAALFGSDNVPGSERELLRQHGPQRFIRDLAIRSYCSSD